MSDQPGSSPGDDPSSEADATREIARPPYAPAAR